VEPPEIGLSWLALATTASPEPSCTSQDQPEPNWLTPASLSLAWKSAKEPNVEAMASASAPAGSPPPLGDMLSQKSVWL
jgi:hypothetical protein